MIMPNELRGNLAGQNTMTKLNQFLKDVIIFYLLGYETESREFLF